VHDIENGVRAQSIETLELLAAAHSAGPRR
jgi:hypothetical protein